MTNVGEISTWHSVVVGVISVGLNSLLLFTVCTRSLKVIGVYKYMMFATTVLDMSFSIVYTFASPTFASVDLLSSLMIVMGGFRFMTHEIGVVLLIAFIFLLCQSIVTPPCLFAFRYLQICRANFLARHYGWLKYLVIVPLFISSICCAMICFAAWPTATDKEMFDGIAAEINVHWNSTYLVASFHKYITGFDRAQSRVMMAAAVSLIIVMVVSLAIMVFCSKCIAEAAIRGCSDVKTRRIQAQLYRTLVAQAAIPLLFIHLPFYLCVIAPLIPFDTGVVSEFLPFLFAWSPAINPLIVLYFVRDYREFVLRNLIRLGREPPSTSNSVFQVVSTKP